MALHKIGGSTPLGGTLAPRQLESNVKDELSEASSSNSSHPLLALLPRQTQMRTRTAHTVADVQDMAISVFRATIGNSHKIVAASADETGRALRELPATAANMTKLAAFEHAAANGPGPATTLDKIASAVGFARNGAAHFVASTAALGAGGRVTEDAGYLADVIESITSVW